MTTTTRADDVPHAASAGPRPQAPGAGASTAPPVTLRQVLAPVTGKIALTTLAGVIASGFSLLPAVAVTALAEGAVTSTLTARAAWLWLGAVVVGLTLGHLIAMSSTGWAHDVESAFRTELRLRIARHLSRLPLGWHTNESSGRTKVLITEDTTAIHSLIAHFGTDLGTALGGIVLGFAYLFTRSWQLAAVLLVWMVLLLVLTATAMALSQGTINEDYLEGMKKVGSSTVEMVDGIATVKAFGLAGTVFRRFDDALDQYTDAAYRYMKGPGRPMALLGALISPAGMLVPVLLAGAWMAGHGIVRPVDLLPFLLVGIGLPSGLVSLVSLVNQVTLGVEAAGRLGALLSEPVLAEPEHPAPVRRDAGGGVSVELDHVSFRYGARDGEEPLPLAVDDVSLRLEPGTVTAVVGPSGSGKSTLVRLIARFWDVESGSVRVGGTDVRETSSADLLSHLGLVLQEGGTLADTVRANIALGRPGATDAEVEAAARAARVHERVMELPQGYDTVLGSEGAHLSGGERQRVALARVFLADAPVLLLDEATAQADAHSEREIQQALARLAAGRTVLVIAHRLSTVVDADQVLVMDHGRLVERGTHTGLLAQGGLYAEMWRAQQ
ncbi:MULTISPECIES: ABC transporter ATP-binding protein [unclassified Actinomyces]|nr:MULTISPECIES: ABC transporter ATP-binding protein [unclassified Actinomyces]MCL3778423.1 ABC transporter ATP-binding protein [Actinomyces sp. AC-20-1]MCL3790738.1 ABC transporter ATP-binding protein [Actinomyces sp. 187325]MCL3793098.1 ABC transporter ATP-binding protein [Actinomyces sp. 186855]MCL3795137.1 ABC transporter ATP-binding protein [Actinomyces sp. 217892]